MINLLDEVWEKMRQTKKEQKRHDNDDDENKVVMVVMVKEKVTKTKKEEIFLSGWKMDEVETVQQKTD